MKKRNIMTVLTVCFVFVSVFLWSENTNAAQITSISQAKEIALKKVPKAVITEVDSDHERGELIYEVELVKGKKKYKIMYRASDAKTLEYGWEIKYVNPSRKNELISMSQCKELARKKVKKGKILSCVKKRDDGVDIYKLKLKTSTKKITLVYHARTGALIEYEWELKTSSSKAKR